MEAEFTMRKQEIIVAFETRSFIFHGFGRSVAFLPFLVSATALPTGALAQMSAVEKLPDFTHKISPKAVSKPPSSMKRNAPKIQSVSPRPRLPDLTISDYEVKFVNGYVCSYRLTFKNIGDGPAKCFSYKILDSVGRSLKFNVCDNPSSSWKLEPGQEITVHGTIDEPEPVSLSKHELWKWPDEMGYMSKIRFAVGPVREKNVNNNLTEYKRIYWTRKKVYPISR